MTYIRALTCVLKCYCSNIPFCINIENSILIKVFRLDNVIITELDI